MPDQYTEEELKEKTRVQLRRLAVSTYGMDNKECSNTKSEDLIAFILDQQDGGGQEDPPKQEKPSEAKGSKSSKKGGRGLARRPGRSKKEDKKEDKKSSKGNGKGRSRAKDPEPEPDPVPVGDVDLSEITERIDAVGGTLDDNQNELKEELVSIAETLDDIKRNQFIQWGLLCDIYSGENAETDLDKRLDELDEEWEKGQTDDEGND